MRYFPIECPKCKDKMIVQRGRRGMYYYCICCKLTLNRKPECVKSKATKGTELVASA